jgi:hypothetical protein
MRPGVDDRGPWAEESPLYDVAEVGAAFVYVLHDLKELDLTVRQTAGGLLRRASAGTLGRVLSL